MRIVFWLESRNVKNIPIRLCPPTPHGGPIRPPFNFRTIGDHLGVCVVTSKVIILNDLCVSHHDIGKNRRQTLGRQVIAPSQPAPFLSFVLESIYVDGYRRARESEYGSEWGIRSVAD